MIGVCCTLLGCQSCAKQGTQPYFSAMSTTVLDSETVLGKRKSPSPLILRLVTDPASHSGPSKKPLIVNGSLVPHTKKRYKCTYNNCEKSYSKPSRLSEHERSHTGRVRCHGSISRFWSFMNTLASIRVQHLQQIISSGNSSPSTCTLSSPGVC
jgi:hypothetical protein